MVGVSQRLRDKFSDELQFLRGWQRDKKGVGALIPTSAFTARRMADVIDSGSMRPVLELGAGTGVITKAILERIDAARLISIEYSEDFFSILSKRFPDVDVRLGDAFALDVVLADRKSEKFDCVISAIPMLSFPMTDRVRLIEDLLARVAVGRPVVQITYGPTSPVAKMPDRYTIKHYDFVVRNLPPAQLWTYYKNA